jgi:hypothetical protein
MRKINSILFCLLFVSGIAIAQPIEKVVIEPLSGGISFNSITFANYGRTGWVTCPSVEMKGRKEIVITNTSEDDNLYLTGVSGSTATGTLYPRDRVNFSASSNMHIYASANSVLVMEVWEIR